MKCLLPAMLDDVMFCEHSVTFFVICELTFGRVSSLVFEELVQSRWSLVRASIGPAGGEPEGEGLDHLSHTFLWTG